MKKKHLNKLKKLAATMPVIFRNTVEYHWIEGKELIADGVLDFDGVAVDPKKTYKVPMPVQVAVNHEHGLIEACKAYGAAGIDLYCTSVENHQMNKEL